MSNQALTVTNFDKIKALANDQTSIERFAQVLGSRSQAHAFITQAVMAVTQNPDLQQCKPTSVLNCVMRAATMQLSLDPSLAQSYLVPFNDRKSGTKTATLIVGWRGIRQMALRTNKYRFINSSELYEGQELVVDQLTGAAVLQGQRISDKVIGYFNFFRLLNGFESVLYMTVEELQAHGQKYAPRNPKWKTDFPAMAKKTVTRLNLLRNGYLDPTDRSALEELDEEAEVEGEVIDSEFTEADDARAEELAKAQKQAASGSRKSANEILGELNPDWGEPPADEPPLEGEFVEQPAENAKEPLRLEPEALRDAIINKAKTMTGQASNGKRGLVVAMLEAVLSHTTDPGESRKQLLKYLTGKSSTKEIQDSVILSLYAWLKPAQDSGGEWVPDAMAAREAVAAFNASQPEQDQLF